MLTCLACNSDATTPLQVVPAAEQHSYIAGERADVKKSLDDALGDAVMQFQIRKCSFCGLEFVAPPQAPSQRWYARAYSALNLYPARRWEYQLALNHAEQHHQVVDIGCGNGEFLRACAERGVVARGLDFSTDAVKSCRAAGLSADLIDLEARVTASATPPSDHVVAFHVLEHLEQPSRIFELAQEFGAPNATLWISVPSDRRPSRFAGDRDLLDQPPHHMTRWTETALREIGALNGWAMVRHFYEPISFRGRLWSVTTQSAPYRMLKPTAIFRSKMTERVLRWALLPIGVTSVIMAGNRLSGFSMMAQYRRLNYA